MACPAFATLHTGAKMPLLGYGTWQAKEGELEAALEEALCAGYRHIDTATVYSNEDVIGKVVHDGWIATGNLSREELFLVTKLPPVGMRPADVEKFLKKSLQDLKTDYVDLYLVHTPMGIQNVSDSLHPVGADGSMPFEKETDHVAIWKAMEEQVEAGRAKAIGLSNFNQRQIQRILDNCRIKPANLQVELHVYMQQRPLVDFCKKNGITVTAYSPLGSRGLGTFLTMMGASKVETPDLISNPVVVEIAEKHKKSPGQVLLKHIVQRGIVAIPKSTNQDRIIQNIQLFDFELSPEDMAKLNSLDKGKDGRILDLKFLKGAEDHPEYPFHEYP